MRVLIQSLIELIAQLTIVVAGLALLAFFWGLAKFIFRVGGDENAVDEGRRIMTWGIIALFVMMSVWGIIRFLQSDFLGICGTKLYKEGDSIPIICPGRGIPDP
ncbi:MAG: hypothetical protein WDZ61_01080, partial [Parcubacteria group bacterium]